MLLASTLSVLALAATSTAPPSPNIDWKLSSEQLASLCQAEFSLVRSRVKSVLDPTGPAAPLDRVLAVETAVANLDEAISIAYVLQQHDDPKVRDAAHACTDGRLTFSVELASNPSLYAAATAAQSSARSAANRMLAQRYAEEGRHGGAALDPKARGELTALLDQIHTLESAFIRTLEEDQAKASIEVSPEEAASLPASFFKTLKKTPSGKGYLVPVGLSTNELVLKNLRPSAARERYQRVFYALGGAANVERLKKVLALRREAAKKLGFNSWAESRTATASARTPERALALVREVDTALLPRARSEVAALAALKQKAGEPGPFSAWDYTFYEARLEQTTFAVDPEVVRQYFPIDVVIPAMIGIFEELLGLKFEKLPLGSGWAADVTGYAVRDATSGALLGWCFLDIAPNPNKLTRPSAGTLRLGRTLPSGGRVLPIALIGGNGPAAAPGERALFTHQGVVEMFHEFGHMMHGLLYAGPHASLAGLVGRADFVEAPSQFFEPWAWDGAILRRVSRHVRTNQPLPEDLANLLGKLRRVSAGVFWSRQAFLAAYDLELNGPAEVKDPTALWHERWAQMTALPVFAGSIPEASFLPEMGGYDSTYYGYLWSRVWAMDMGSAFQKAGLTNREVGMRYRRMVLEPGASAEPEALITGFLGRPPQPDAFYEELGLTRAKP
jgi:Zn-dependent oligopeptidase